MQTIKEKARQAYRDQQSQDTEGGCREPDGFVAGYLAAYAEFITPVGTEFEAEINDLLGDIETKLENYKEQIKKLNKENAKLKQQAEDYMGMYQVISKREQDYLSDNEEMANSYAQSNLPQTVTDAYLKASEIKDAEIERLNQIIDNYRYDHAPEECTTLEALWFNRGVHHIESLINSLKEESDNRYFQLRDCKELLKRFLPKDEAEWDKIIQLTETEKDAMTYFRSK